MLKVLAKILPALPVLRPLPVKIQDLPETVLIERYIEAGKLVGEDLFDIMVAGESIDFEEKFNRWAELEKEYARRGYKTIGTYMFTYVYGSDAANDLFTKRCVGKKREAGEKPVLHAEIYRENFLGKDPLDYGCQPYTEKIVNDGR